MTSYRTRKSYLFFSTLDTGNTPSSFPFPRSPVGGKANEDVNHAGRQIVRLIRTHHAHYGSRVFISTKSRKNCTTPATVTDEHGWQKSQCHEVCHGNDLALLE